MHVFYLHGFASSPLSSKAQFFAARFAERGIALQIPDFNLPEFSSLTVTRMLDQLAGAIRALPPGDIVLMGSSLGGFVAVEAAARSVDPLHPVRQLTLLAPALDLRWEHWEEVGQGGSERWRRNGSIEVFHYGYEERRSLRFAFYEDAVRYAPARRVLELPMLIFQGLADESVEPASVERFARHQPRAVLHLLEDGHQLKESLGFMWDEIGRSGIFSG